MRHVLLHLYQKLEPFRETFGIGLVRLLLLYLDYTYSEENDMMEFDVDPLIE
jgi:hypothetical protein